MRRSWKSGETLLPAALLGTALAAGCATSPSSGPPLADPGRTASRLEAGSGAQAPARIRFRWEYGDEQGRLRGDGLARVNPPDSFRLDLFTSGEGSMAVALAADSLSTLGQIEDLELPEPPFLYAMAGVFRPGSAVPDTGWSTEDGSALSFATRGGRERIYLFEGERLVRLEERARGRLTQRIRVTWGTGAWPAAAEYRNLERPRRVEWHLEEVSEGVELFPSEIFELVTDG